MKTELGKSLFAIAWLTLALTATAANAVTNELD
jgi:hypothetical protein